MTANIETAESFDADSRPLGFARSNNLQICSNKEKGLIEITGIGDILRIHDISITDCTITEDAFLIETSVGKKIVLKSSSSNGRLSLLKKINNALEESNCTLRFSLPEGEEFSCLSEESNGNHSQDSTTSYLSDKSLSNKVGPLIGIGLIILLFGMIMSASFMSTTSNPEEENNDNTPVAEDAWEARLKREQEEWNKKQRQEIESQPSASIPKNNDTEIASVIVSVSCAGSKGLIPRSQMGSMMKQIFNDKGIDSTEVYGNWDYYWGIAKEMDAHNQTYCMK